MEEEMRRDDIRSGRTGNAAYAGPDTRGVGVEEMDLEWDDMRARCAGQVHCPGPGLRDAGAAVQLGMFEQYRQYVRTDDAEERGAAAGYNVQIRGDRLLLHPRISRSDFATLEMCQNPSADEMFLNILETMAGLSAAARDKFKLTRRAVWREMPDGVRRLVLVPRVPAASNDADLVEGLGLMDALRGAGVEPVPAEVIAARKVKRTFTLLQVFYDAAVADKYPVSLRQLEASRRVAASDPVSAARMMQEAMNASQGHVAVRVTANDWATSKKQAVHAMHIFCRGYRTVGGSADAEVVAGKLYVHAPGGEDWYVCGPLEYATTVMEMHALVAAEGRIFPNVLLAHECVLLGIDVGDHMSMEEPRIEYHAGCEGDDLPVGMPEATASVVSVDTRMRLMGLSGRLVPVLASNGVTLATAVRVSDNHVLVNSHVADADAASTVGGEPMRPYVQLARDVWAARLEGDAPPWKLRDPTAGELVVLCGLGPGGVFFSAPLRVTSVDYTCMVLSKDSAVVSGMSGSAVVALSDMALLGIHSASTNIGLVAYRFGPTQFTDLMSRDMVSSVSKDSDVESFGGRVYAHFRKRGLLRLFKDTAASLVDLRSGSLDHVGMSVRVGSKLYTTCDTELGLKPGGSATMPVWRTTVGAVGVRETDSACAVPGPSPAFTREPEVMERVFLVGYDGDLYVSSETRVNYVGLDAKSFVVGCVNMDVPFQGGLVMAWDGAVLGLVGHRSHSTPVGLGIRCWEVPKPQEPAMAQASPREVLARQFPFLNLAVWSDALLEEVFTHSSVGAYKSLKLFNAGQRPLANVGDNAAKMELYASLRAAGVAHPAWAQYMQKLQSNSAYAQLAWDKGYAVCMLTGAGASFPASSKAYADLTEALLGAAALVEERAVFTKLCTAMGLVYQAPEGDGNVERTPVARFSLPAGDGTGATTEAGSRLAFRPAGPAGDGDADLDAPLDAMSSDSVD